MVDIGWNDGAARRHFLTHKFRRDIIRNMRAETLTVTRELLLRCLAPEIFANGDEFHFGRDNARPRIGKLRHRLARRRFQRLMTYTKFRRQAFACGKTVILRLDVPTLIGLDITARDDPVMTQTRQTLFDQDCMGMIGIRAGGIIDRHRRLARRRVHRDLAHRHAEIRMQNSGLMDFRGGGMRAGCNNKRYSLGSDIHLEAPKFNSGDPVRAGMMENTCVPKRGAMRRPTSGLCTVPTPV